MTTKECIACAELIQEKASLCRYCGTTQISTATSGQNFDSYLNDFETKGSASSNSKAKTRVQGANVGSISCPICQLSDRVEKVSAVVSGGRSNSSSIAVGNIVGTSNVGLASAFSSSQTELSSRLHPGAPQAKQNWVMGPLAGTVVSTIFVRNFMLGEVSSSDGLASVALWGMSLVYAAVPGVILGLLVSWIDNNRLKKSAEHQSALSSWQVKSEQILKMHYCFRDDVVFGSGTGPQTPEEFYR